LRVNLWYGIAESSFSNQLTGISCFSLALDIAEGRQGGPIITFSPHGNNNQKWYFDDDFTIRSGTGMVIDIEGGRSNQGTRVIGYQKHGGHNQKFRIEPYNRKN
jgi:hypothetical protein